MQAMLPEREHFVATNAGSNRNVCTRFPNNVFKHCPNKATAEQLRLKISNDWSLKIKIAKMPAEYWTTTSRASCHTAFSTAKMPRMLMLCELVGTTMIALHIMQVMTESA